MTLSPTEREGMEGTIYRPRWDRNRSKPKGNICPHDERVYKSGNHELVGEVQVVLKYLVSSKTLS